MVIYSFYRLKNSLIYIIKGNWIKRNSPLDIKGSVRRIAGSIFSNTAVAVKFIGGVAATGLTIDQTQDLLGLSENNDWRLKKNTISFGKKLGIQDKIDLNNNKIEIDKEVLDKLQKDSKILQALKESESESQKVLQYLSKDASNSKPVPQLVSLLKKDL